VLFTILFTNLKLCKYVGKRRLSVVLSLGKSSNFLNRHIKIYARVDSRWKERIQSKSGNWRLSLWDENVKGGKSFQLRYSLTSIMTKFFTGLHEDIGNFYRRKLNITSAE